MLRSQRHTFPSVPVGPARHAALRTLRNPTPVCEETCR
jgi:hypothetical protein